MAMSNSSGFVDMACKGIIYSNVITILTYKNSDLSEKQHNKIGMAHIHENEQMLKYGITYNYVI